MFDWFHNGEGYSAFNLQGLPEPNDRAMQVRIRRYFDPEKQRAGIPEDVAALVEKISDDEATVHVDGLLLRVQIKWVVKPMTEEKS